MVLDAVRLLEPEADLVELLEPEADLVELLEPEADLVRLLEPVAEGVADLLPVADRVRVREAEEVRDTEREAVVLPGGRGQRPPGDGDG